MRSPRRPATEPSRAQARIHDRKKRAADEAAGDDHRFGRPLVALEGKGFGDQLHRTGSAQLDVGEGSDGRDSENEEAVESPAVLAEEAGKKKEAVAEPGEHQVAAQQQCGVAWSDVLRLGCGGGGQDHAEGRDGDGDDDCQADEVLGQKHPPARQRQRFEEQLRLRLVLGDHQAIAEDDGGHRENEQLPLQQCQLGWNHRIAHRQTEKGDDDQQIEHCQNYQRHPVLAEFLAEKGGVHDREEQAVGWDRRMRSETLSATTFPIRRRRRRR